ncbi:MAG: DEAD/DEAH box helicase [Bacteroidales bacterium]
MYENNTEKPVPGDKLVFAIRFHEFLEVILLPYLVHESKTGEFSYSTKQLNSLTLSDHFKNCTEEEKLVVSLLDECRDDELLKKFSKKAKTVAGFFKEQTETRLKTLILPYIQRRTDKCLRILMNAGVPLYFKGRKNDPVLSEPIVIHPEEAKAVFNFIRLDSESHYYLTLRHAGQDIKLNTPGSLILANSPGWVFTGGNVYNLEKGIDGNKLRPFFTKDHIVIPASAEEKYFNGFVTNAIRNHEVITRGIDLDIETPQCTPVLKLETDLAGYPVLMLYFKYGNKKCLWTDTHNCWVKLTAQNGNYSFIKLLRKREDELKYAGMLVDRGLASDDRNTFRLIASGLNGNHASDKKAAPLYSLVEWLSRYSGELEVNGFELQQGFYKESFYTGNISLEMDVRENSDWFDVHAVAVFGEFRVPFLKLKTHLLNGVREYTLPDGQMVILPEEWFSHYKELLIYGKSGGDNIRLGKHHYTIAERIGRDLNISGDLHKLSEKEKLSIPDLPGELTGVLRPYQKAGFAWIYFLHKNRLGGCLADDMGLGKTLQTLTLLWKLKNEYIPAPSFKKIDGKKNLQLDIFAGQDSSKGRALRTSLIVMPLSLMHNWENEIKKFTPGLSCVKYTGISRDSLSENLADYDIVLTTYGVIRNDLELLLKFEFFYLILDESQIIKNPKSKISRAVRLLKAENRLVLTGTPIENSLTDLWSQLTFLNPGILGGQQFFQEEFVNPIEKFHDEEKKNILKTIIEPFILRRTKTVVEKDLPALSEKVYYCEMSDDQRKLYDTKKSEIRNGIFEKMNSPEKRNLKIDVLKGLMQLRLIANHPGLSENRSEESGKFEEVIRNIENLISEGHKVLIFSQFVKHLNLYRRYFESMKWKHAYLTGELNASQRQQVISGFQNDPENLLFLISLRAGGVGLNLTAADYVFILDPWWNPAVEQQAISRAHRIGQKRNVFSYKFISKDSVEEKILRLQRKKSDLAGDFINSNDPIKLFTDEEILGLFE